MADAQEKTAALQRLMVPMDSLVKQEVNPNKMKPREFDLLVDNLQRVGMVDPLFVRPLGDGRYRIVGGQHRYEAAKYLGFTEVPVTVVDHDDFDADQERFQVVRMNVIHGKLDPVTFFSLYQQLSDRYAEEVLQDAFGFAEDAEFKRLIDRTARELPDPAMRKAFVEAAAEIKTIDGLAALLNTMFTRYGSSLPFGYMIIDFGGQRSVWLRVTRRTMDAIDLLGATCMLHDVTMDDVVGPILERIARGSLPGVLAEVLAAAPRVRLPADMQVLPTKDNVATVESLQAPSTT